MRYLLAFLLPVALAERALEAGEEDGLHLPELAGEHYWVEETQSHIVKLECLGCPFSVRVREQHEVVETWQEPPQENSLMLNFTIASSESSILLNGDPLLPFASQPPAITAFQVPANLTADMIEHIVDFSMLRHNTEFELQYEYRLLATAQPDLQYLQFDVTGVHNRQLENPRSYRLSKPGQKMVEILLHREVADGRDSVVARSLNIIKRGERNTPLKMPCGKDAMVQIEYNPLEWDYYGKIGTWSRTWNMLPVEAWSWFERNWFNLHVVIFVSILISVVRRRIVQSRQEAAVLRAGEDQEAALLVDESADAPPEYEDAVASEEEKLAEK